MIRIGAGRLALVLSGALVVSGCEEGAGVALGQGGASGARGEAQYVEQDVEAPDVFSVSEPGLWDGRPSLGGVWVAHPNVKEPDRVMIRNAENGRSVIGALFKRETSGSGPRLQVSSDAAQALGILAGDPTNLEVVVLKRERILIEPEPVAEEELEVSEAVMAEPGEIEAETLADPLAAAAAAIDAVEAGEAGGEVVEATGAAAATAAGAAAGAVVEEAVEERPRWWQRRRTRDVEEGVLEDAPEAEVAEEAEPAAAPTPEPQPRTASSLSKPFIQIGIFSVQANAERTATNLRAKGLLATVLEQTSRGKTFWRVVVGPAANAAARSEALEQVKAMGFTDAYYVDN
ncbi:MAG: SPOR domain-containing protein [Rhodobacteraceae bacterium]|nr:SPOR domain-containing protein [Paracoccaceae bacterium]